MSLRDDLRKFILEVFFTLFYGKITAINVPGYELPYFWKMVFFVTQASIFVCFFTVAAALRNGSKLSPVFFTIVSSNVLMHHLVSINNW